MNSKRILTLLAGLLLMVPVLAWGTNSIVLESKTLAPNLNGSPAFTVKVSISNDDSLTFLTLVLAEQTTAGTAYALLNSPRSYTGIINNLTNTLKFSSIANAGATIYNDASPDSFLAAGGFDPTDPTTIEPPNAGLKPVWEIKFKHTSDSVGQVTLRACNGTISSQSNTFTNTAPVDIKPIPVTPGILTITVPGPTITNCAGATQNVLYGRTFSYDFNSDQDPNAIYSIVSGPGSIDPNTGVYSFAGQCPLGDIPVDVRATNQFQTTGDCQFTLHIIDNAPTCTPASPTVTVSHGAVASNHINTADPDAGDVVTVHQTSGPGSTSPGGDWSYQTSCQDVNNPQTVQEQVVDGFGQCTPGPLSATCEFRLVVTNAPPSITCPPSAQVQAGSPYSANASVSDPDPADAGSLVVTGTAVPPITGFVVSPSGNVQAAPTVGDAGPHVITLTVTDGCGATAQCSYTLTVVVGAKFHICIDTIHAFNGTDVEVAVRNLVDATDPNIANGKSVGGFSFLFSYDCSCLEFLSAREGALLVQQRWEFFTFRFGAVGNGNCGAGCPSCLIRVVAIADVNNGASHPNLTRQNQGEWVVLKFRTSNDRRLAGQCCPISWFWFDCNDNTVSDSTGNRLWVVDSLYTFNGAPVDLATAFPNNVANCDQFSGGPNKPTPIKFIIFCNGAICLPTPGEIDDRGDMNLNGLKNEIADAVLYENYFIYGPSVLSSDPTRRQGQIAASDVNGDGTVLSVADLVTMIRIITGDANPVPKTIPADWTVNLAMASSPSEVALSANSGAELGGLYLKFRVSGTVGAPALSGAAEGMTLRSDLVGNELSVLIYSESKAKIAANAGAILRIPANGNVELVESEAASYFGSSLPTVSKVAALPTAFGISQNYPNPFNGKTSFVLSLPVASDFKVTVYNVAGQVVRTFEGSAPAGNRTIVWDGTDAHGTPVSSGVYFYKAAAKDFSVTKKMLYLK